MKALASFSAISFLVAATIPAAVAAEATSEETYTVPARFQTSIDWFNANRPKFYKAANAEVLQSYGNHEYLVRSRTPVGSSTYVVKETETREEGVTVFQIKFLKPVSGRVEDMISTVTIKDRGGQTEVTMTTYIDFRHLLASSRAVKRVTDKSVSQTKELLVTHVPQ